MSTPQEEYQRKVDEIHSRRAVLGWSQARLARRVRRSSALVSRALTGAVWMPGVLDRLLATLEREEARRGPVSRDVLGRLMRRARSSERRRA